MLNKIVMAGALLMASQVNASEVNWEKAATPVFTYNYNELTYFNERLSYDDLGSIDVNGVKLKNSIELNESTFSDIAFKKGNGNDVDIDSLELTLGKHSMIGLHLQFWSAVGYERTRLDKRGEARSLNSMTAYAGLKYEINYELDVGFGLTHNNKDAKKTKGELHINYTLNNDWHLILSHSSDLSNSETSISIRNNIKWY